MPRDQHQFTQTARNVLSLAHETAERLEHNVVGSQHLLLALLHVENTAAWRVLHDLGLDSERIEKSVARFTPRHQKGQAAQLDLSEETKQIVEAAVEEARPMEHYYIGTEHLLLGLSNYPKTVAIEVLKRHGISPEELRRQTIRVLQEPIPQSSASGMASSSNAFSVLQWLKQYDQNVKAVLTEMNVDVDQFWQLLEARIAGK